jgi:hypothetical protein
VEDQQGASLGSLLYVVATVFFEKIFDDRTLGPRLINNKNVFRRTIKKESYKGVTL